MEIAMLTSILSLCKVVHLMKCLFDCHGHSVYGTCFDGYANEQNYLLLQGGHGMQVLQTKMP
jgi:hypothetical protein